MDMVAVSIVGNRRDAPCIETGTDYDYDYN